VITLDEFVSRLCQLGADRGPRAFPRRRRDRDILIKSIRMGMDSERVYTEPEINESLRRWRRDVAPAITTDHVTLRRILVDHGHLERTADGRVYRVGFPARTVAFELEIDDLDLPATISAYRESVRSRRRGAPPVGG
jgi:hypothetical protein